MDSFLFLFIFITFGVSLFILGTAASRNIRNRSDFFLAGRDLGIASVTFTLIAIQMGGNMILGAAEWAYDYGLYGILYAVGMSTGFLLLASGFAARLQASGITTTAELFEKRYNSRGLRTFAALVSIASLLGILVSIVVSSRTLLHGLGIHHETIFLIFWSIIIGYIMMGGLHAVVLTDIAQVVFIIMCIGGVFLYDIIALPNSLIPLSDLIAAQSKFNITPFSYSKALTAFLMPALFALIEQDLAQPLFAARSQAVALLSALFAAIFIIGFGAIPIYFGMQARLSSLPMISHANPFIMITEATTSPFIFALIVCSIIAAISSTANSLVCAISANIVQDCLPVIGNERTMVRISKWVTFLTGILAVAGSYYIRTAIIDIAISSYEISVSCLLVPLVCALYTKKPHAKAAFSAAFAGLVGYILFRHYVPPLPKEIATLLLSAIGYILVTRLVLN